MEIQIIQIDHDDVDDHKAERFCSMLVLDMACSMQLRWVIQGVRGWSCWGGLANISCCSHFGGRWGSYLNGSSRNTSSTPVLEPNVNGLDIVALVWLRQNTVLLQGGESMGLGTLDHQNNWSWSLLVWSQGS